MELQGSILLCCDKVEEVGDCRGGVKGQRLNRSSGPLDVVVDTKGNVHRWLIRKIIECESSNLSY